MSIPKFMPGFTPGPWGIERTSDSNWVGVLRPDGKVEEIVMHNSRSFDYKREYVERQDANANLIAAAPDLYAACSAFIDAWRFDDDEEKDEAIADMLTALAKARGEAQP